MASHLPAFGVILLLPGSFLPAVQGLPLTSTPPSPLAVASRLPLLATPPQALRDHFGWPKLEHAASDKGEGVWALLRKGVDPRAHEDLHLWSANLRSPRLQRLLHEECAPVSCATMSEHSISSDGTQKLLLQLEDGLAVECVVIPMPGGTTSSLCISSQVGCSHACAFCSTGTMGLLRNLRAEEILAQVWMAQRVVREQRLPALVNIVFMGMGEPLNNFEQVATLDVSRILLQWIPVFSNSPLVDTLPAGTDRSGYAGASQSLRLLSSLRVCLDCRPIAFSHLKGRNLAPLSPCLVSPCSGRQAEKIAGAHHLLSHVGIA